MSLGARVRRTTSTYGQLWRQAPTLSARAALAAVGGVVALAFLQLVLSLCFSSQYVDWFLTEHGMTRSTAPKGEIAGIYAGLAFRVLFSVCWVWSFSKLVEMLERRDRNTLLMLRGYALVCILGYGYLAFGGGPWWLTGVRWVQCVLGLVLGVAVLLPRAAAWFNARGPARTRRQSSALSDG